MSCQLRRAPEELHELPDQVLLLQVLLDHCDPDHCDPDQVLLLQVLLLQVLLSQAFPAQSAPDHVLLSHEVPDQLVPLTPAVLALGRDATVEAALGWIDRAKDPKALVR